VREKLFSWVSFLRLVQYCASALVFDPDGRVLLVKHRLRGGWEWPAGGGKLGEVPDQAVVREIKEETGIELNSPRLIAVYVRSFPGLASRFNFTFAEQVSAEVAAAVKFDRVELLDIRWVEVAEAQQLVSRRLLKRFNAAIQSWKDGTVAYVTSKD
jgi:8-oxo-dGTP pyrophosphatase MutT (NUDIX family)